jgi:putative PEP-CTERM system TPR-repeat lipoprotein
MPIRLFRTFCFSLFTLVVACGGESFEPTVDRAREYLAEGKYPEALIELKNAASARPEDAEVRLLLGQTHIQLGDLLGAEKELEKSRKLGVEPGQVVPLLARVYGAQNKLDEVLELSVGGLTPDQQAVVLAAKGLAKLRQGELAEAHLMIDSALEADPSSSHALIARAQLLNADPGTPSESVRSQVEQVLEADPTYGPAWGLLGELDAREKHLEAAEANYSKAIELDALSRIDLLRRAMVRLELGKYAEAQQDIDQLKKIVPKSTAVNYAQGLVYFALKEYESALYAFEIALWDEGRYPLALYYSGVIHASLGNETQAESFLEQYHLAAPGSVQGSIMLASLRLSQRNYAAVEEIVVPVLLVQEDNTDALVMLAKALQGQGKPEEAIDVLEKVVSLEPESAAARVQLGAALLTGERREQGISQLEEAIRLDPQNQLADVMLVLDHLQKSEHQAAVAAALDYQSRNPDMVAPYILLGRSYLASGDEPKARSTLGEALQMSPGDPEVSHNLALIALKNRELDAARSLYLDVLAKHPNNLTALVKLARLDALEGKHDAMIKNLKSAIAAHPTAVEPRVVLANYYLAHGKEELVTSVFSGLIESRRNTPPVLRPLASAQLARGQFSEAELTLKQLLKIQPESAYAHFELSKAYAGLGDEKKTRSELITAVDLAPDELRPRLALASLLLQGNEITEAELQLTALKESNAGHPDVLQLEVMLAASKGDHARALTLAQQLFDQSPSTFTVLSLAQKQKQMGGEKEAIELLERWCKENPRDVATGLNLASAYIDAGRIADATYRYEQVLEADPDNIMALNNLAWYLRETDSEKALDYAGRAFQQAPDSTKITDTLAMVQLAAGETDKARATLQSVKVKEPNNLTLQYHSALIDISAGETSRALATLSSILEGGQSFPQRAEAEEVFDQLMR